MTKKEIREKAVQFINSLDSESKNEWYHTDRVIYGDCIEEFFKTALGIDLYEED